MRAKYHGWLRALWNTYAPILHITNVRPVFKYKKDLGGALMKCTFRYPYLDNEIQYGDSIINEWKKDKQEAEQVALHEFCHIVTDAMYAKAISRYVTTQEIEDERERLTDHMANIIFPLVNKK